MKELVPTINQHIPVDILIIGFGLSTIPLVRELDRDAKDYVIISRCESIWDSLEEHGRLDFDLVSSLHSSMFSFELVNHDTRDRYQTAREFYELIRRYKKEYGSKVVDDEVTLVENHASFSLVHTKSPSVYKARQLVISTAFTRTVRESLNTYDFDVAFNKTIVLDFIGDSANLMISKLVPQNNRIIVVCNGFVALDKMFFYNDRTYTLDQLEYHNIRHISKYIYGATISAGIVVALNFPWACRPLFAENFYTKHPVARRSTELSPSIKPTLRFAPVRNGVIAIKYWPIDAFKRLFDNNSLKQSIAQGYLLNDLPYFIDKGIVELWPKEETSIDVENRVIRWGDKVVQYDQLFQADKETPNLPPIMIKSESSPDRRYQYKCRDNFMGIVPKDPSNVYLLGIIRPTTGGLNNITEMQCLFTHRMLADASFNSEIKQNLCQRIRDYNRNYHSSPFARPTDHLVFYGFYTDDIARLLKIHNRLSDCRSFKDVLKYLVFPNNAFKYRQTGPYKVDGVKEMADRILEEHSSFALIIGYVATYVLIQLTIAASLWSAIANALPPPMSYVTTAPLLVVALLQPFTQLVAANTVGLGKYINTILALTLASAVLGAEPLILVVGLGAALGLTYVGRRLGWTRVFFNDMRHKKDQAFQDFFERYCQAYREVRAVAPMAAKESR